MFTRFQKCTLALAIMLMVSSIALAQNPQSQGPLYATNAKYANGVAPGYMPCGSAGINCPSTTGLNLNIGPGTANCAGTIIQYSGGTLSLTASTTNYVYLNTGSSCAVDVKTTGFVAADIPIAEAITNSSGITTLTDVRTQFFVPSSSSGILPSAPAPGQIITSVAAGMNYGDQPQIFYNQTGDTISSIETECSSSCTYVVTQSQTITLGASHTLNANVNLRFEGGGEWTVNGSGFTLTIGGFVDGTPTQHFAGSAGILFSAQTERDYPEWWGAKGDGVTSDCTAIQNAINAVSGSTSPFLKTGIGNVQLLAKSYLCNSTLNIENAGIGLFGVNNGSDNPPFSTTLKTSVANTTQLNIEGASGQSNWLTGNTVKYVNFVRTTQDTSGIAISVQNTFRTVIEDVGIYDSHIGLYLANVGGGGIGRFDSVQIYQDGTSSSSGTYYGFYIDSTSGQSTPSLRLINDTIGAYSSGFTHYYGLYATGSDIQDIHVTHLETAEVGYGIYLNSTSSGGLQNGDDHFWNSILDGCQVSCIYVTGMTTAGGSSVEFSGGNIENDGSDPTIDLEGSNGITLAGLHIVPNPVHSSTAQLIKVNGGGANGITGNHLLMEIGSLSGIVLNSTDDNVISSNTIQGSNSSDVGISLVNSSYNALSGNALSGTMSVGLSLDSGSNNNTASTINSVDPASIATPISNSGSNNTIGAASANPILSITNAGTTGTTLNTLTKITGAPSTAVKTSTTDTGGIAGIVTNGAGTSGTATIQLAGPVSCVFSNGTASNDYVQNSTATNGDCMDVGSTYPSAGQVIGRVLSTNASAGTYQILLYPAEIKGSSGSGGFPSPVTVTASSAVSEIDLTSCINSSYRDYEIRFSHISMQSGSSISLLIQFSTNNGSTWDTASNYNYSRYYAQISTSNNSGLQTSQTGTGIGPTLASADTFSTGYIDTTEMILFDPLSSTDSVKMGSVTTQVYQNTFSSVYQSAGGFAYNQGSGVNAVRLIAGGGGTFTGQVTCQPLAQ